MLTLVILASIKQAEYVVFIAFSARVSYVTLVVDTAFIVVLILQVVLELTFIFLSIIFSTEK